MPSSPRTPDPTPTEPAGPDDLALLSLQGDDMLRRTAEAHAAGWGLGSGGTWALDPHGPTLTWTFPDGGTAHAPAQLLGTYAPAASAWRWGWAHASLPAVLRRDAERLRAWGEEHGHGAFATPDLEVDEAMLATLVGIAFRVTGATGFYRGGSSGTVPYLTFGEVTVQPHDGPSRTFRVAVDD